MIIKHHISFAIYLTLILHSTCYHSKKDTEIRQRELLESISPALLSYLQGHAQKVVLDKSACVLVADILGAAVGDVQPAMNAVASLAAAELHPGGKDGEVLCYRETGGKATVAAKTPITGNIAIKRILVIINSPHTHSTFGNCEFKTVLLTLTVF